MRGTLFRRDFLTYFVPDIVPLMLVMYMMRKVDAPPGGSNVGDSKQRRASQIEKSKAKGLLRGSDASESTLDWNNNRSLSAETAPSQPLLMHADYSAPSRAVDSASDSEPVLISRQSNAVEYSFVSPSLFRYPRL